eukprot:10210078-Lingulodinium_polyedra.AAC.1
MAATPTCTCRRSATAAGGKLRIAAGVHCRWVWLPPPVTARAWTMAWSEMPLYHSIRVAHAWE